MLIALAQINCVLGDFKGNRLKIEDAIQRAQEKSASLIVFPELSLMGYLPNDLLERPSIIDEQLKEFKILIKKIPAGMAVLVGLITKSGLRKGKPFYNSAALLIRGQKPKFFHKELLPTYDVFDEARHIEKGRVADGFFKFSGRRILVTICEDIWGWELRGHPTNYLENPLKRLKGPVDLVVNMSASPFTVEKARDRRAVVSQTAKHFRAPMIYVNLVGGQDEVIFDGGSFAVSSQGDLKVQADYCREDLRIFDLGAKIKAISPKLPTRESSVRDALVLGIADFVRKSGLSKVHFGLSGGIDSALVACLAVEALGAKNVTAITLPGPFNESRSRTLAEELAAQLGIRCLNFSIEESYQTLLHTLEQGLGKFEFGVVNENLQSRLRGMVLMALANKEGSMLLTTGNKSEYATGYSTLYGDMCGGLAPIGDLLKRDVYLLSELYRRERGWIPEQIITRAPSAELRPNQKDQDSLPPYPLLDQSVQNLVEKQRPAKSETERWVLSQLFKSEFKRWQAPPILKVSPHAFGRGRRMPLAQKASK